jgi:hypothetical protein
LPTVIKRTTVCTVECMSEMEVVVPDFIVAGGMRCATGWIRQCLRDHPEIYMPQREPHFFDRNYDMGIDWYHEFFTSHGGERVVGEKTATYFHYVDSPSKMMELNPDVKVVICLRDPIERMFSHYSMFAESDSALRKTGFVESMLPETDFLNWSLYANQVENFMHIIPQDNLLFMIYEEKDKDPVNFIRDIYTFLSVDSSFKAPSAELRTKLGQFEHNNWFWGRFSKLMLHPRAPDVFRAIYSGMRPSSAGSRLRARDYEQLSGYFTDEIPRLESLLGKSLDFWETKRAISR